MTTNQLLTERRQRAGGRGQKVKSGSANKGHKIIRIRVLAFNL
jgi:hypothetical protein